MIYMREFISNIMYDVEWFLMEKYVSHKRRCNNHPLISVCLVRLHSQR